MSKRVTVTLLNGKDAMSKKQKKNSDSKPNATSTTGGSKKNRKRRHGHKKNSSGYSASATKPNKKSRKGHRRNKRNDAGAGGGGETVGMAILKTFGALAAGVGLGVLGQLLLGATSYSGGVQNTILIVGGLVVGAAAMLISKGKAKRLSVALAVGPAAVGMGRQMLAWGIVNPQSLDERMQQMMGSNTATATASSQLPAPTATATATAPTGTAPAGYLTGDPYWNPAMAGTQRLGTESAGPVYMGG